MLGTSWTTTRSVTPSQRMRSAASSSGNREIADAGIAEALAEFKALEARCDVVVIEGTDFAGPSSPPSSTSTPVSPAISARPSR